MTQSLEQDADMIQQAIAASESAARDEDYQDTVQNLPTLEVTLPGGYLDLLDGTLHTDAVVREMNGYDEEALSRITSKKNYQAAELLNALLSRCVESIGGDPDVTADMLDMLYTADWDALLLHIRIVSFGNEVIWKYPCQFCNEERTVTVDLLTDVETRPLKDSSFVYKGKRTEYLVGYPKGSVTRDLLRISSPTTTDIVTTTLLHCIKEISGTLMISKETIKAMPSADREGIMQKISEEAPAVLLGEVKKTCPGCEEDVYVPLNLAALFQGRVVGL